MKRKAIKIIIIALCLIAVMSLFVGCTDDCTGEKRRPITKYEDREVGDFSVRFQGDYCEILGTSMQGVHKKFLVVPSYIDGVRVESFGVHQPFVTNPDKLLPPQIFSDIIEKIYFESAIKVSSNAFNNNDYSNFHCSNLKKVLYPGIQDYPYRLKIDNLLYNPRSMLENLGNNGSSVKTLPANVSYYYNYENAPNDGYYWIDDCDYGRKIEYVPTDPTREGYTFGGWYKEKECKTEWDFYADTLPELQSETEELYVNGELVQPHVAVYQETILYAKWK